MGNDQQFSKYRWVILGLCVTCFLFTFITRFAWPPLISVVAPVLGINMTQAGAYMSAFYIGYVLTQIPAGILADRFGVRYILAVSLIMEGLSTSSLSFIHDYHTGFVLRILAGLGAGAVFSSCSRALVEWFPEHERGKAFGILLASLSGGILISNFLAPTLNQMVGWRGTFQAIGSLTIFAGVLIFLFMRSNVDLHEENESVLQGCRIIFGNANLLLTASAGFFLMWLELGTATWANAHIKGMGYSVSDAGNVMMWYGLGGVLSPLIFGYISDRIGQRKPIIVCALIATVPTTLLFGAQTSLDMLQVCGFIAGFCTYIANPQLTILVSNYAGRKWAATANGVSNFLFQLASLISPLVTGMVIDATGHFMYVWWILVLGPVVSTFLILRIRENRDLNQIQMIVPSTSRGTFMNRY
jgi:predicted MFS family arabinose efflux permease